MIQWVCERASRARLVDRVIVATPDADIVQAVQGFGGKAVITSPDHRSGTDRLAEVAAGLTDHVIVNVQGDEPLIDPSAIDALIKGFFLSGTEMASLMRPISGEDAQNPNLVKVVTDVRGYALYFSRALIPHIRDKNQEFPIHGHVGLYAYTKDMLVRLASLAPTPLEMAESLEQLRALENGFKIFMVETEFAPVGVDTLEDLERVRKIIEQGA